MTVLTQQTLAGDTAEKSRTRPATWAVCQTCGAVMQRLERFDHPHDTTPVDQLGDDEEDGDDEPEVIGSWYTVTLEVSVTYQLSIPAETEHQAKERAQMRQYEVSASDRHTLHTDVRERGEITEADVDDEWVIGEPIWDHLDGDAE